MKKLVQNAKGFTLVELMIVVAIIGILAAIAIPQFAAYRTRGFNSSGQSDVRNLNTSEAAYFSDWQVFGGSGTVITAAVASVDEAGVIVTAPVAAGASLITSTDVGLTPRSLVIPLGNGVSIHAATGGVLSNFLAVGKHAQADTTFAVDANSSAVYFCQGAAQIGALPAVTVILPAITNGDDFTGGAVACPVAADGFWATK